MLKNWEDIRYLQAGDEQQRQAFAVLKASQLFELLAPFHPILAGTIPLGIALSGSDLDIACEVYDLDRFEQAVAGAFGHHPDFTIRRREKNQLPVLICGFTFDGIPFEIFGQPRPVTRQNAYVHMVVEARLLSLAGPPAASAIRQLKAEGLKTEPAFAHYFQIGGDPYEALLHLAERTDEELRTITANRASAHP